MLNYCLFTIACCFPIILHPIKMDEASRLLLNYCLFTIACCFQYYGFLYKLSVTSCRSVKIIACLLLPIAFQLYCLNFVV